ncbi:hypothetical protein Mgra_00009275 [Meloidogyne graminicola]|uniref:Uncharacterized protein n=1 Tax=Meloidogyne graminicola TaxID=189291 RepID=A0A8S9ZDF3_9BILA|nr:hypothetical protein Mgra_00009275 [Meloidogyne graminicola]
MKEDFIQNSLSFYSTLIFFISMANQGIKNIKNQLEINGEYNNPEQERLFLWINQSTFKDSVFAGTMALMANLKLSTLRPIVNHPHYENEEIRKRTLRVYSIYSRKSVKEVYFDLKSMGIQFYVFQPQQCLQEHPKKECKIILHFVISLFLPVYITETYVFLLKINFILKKILFLFKNNLTK